MVTDETFPRAPETGIVNVPSVPAFLGGRQLNSESRQTSIWGFGGLDCHP